MTALHQRSSLASAATIVAPALPGPADVDRQWAAVNAAGAAVAALARVDPAAAAATEEPLSVRLAGLDRAAVAVAENGVSDLAMILQPGLRALATLAAAGGDAAAPARVLWQEFISARRAILSLGREGAPAS